MKKLIILLACIFTITLSGCNSNNFNSGEVSGFKYENCEKYNIGDITYNDETINKLSLNWVCGNVKILKGDIISIKEIKDLEPDKKVRSIIENGNLKVQFWKSDYKAIIDSTDKEVIITITDNIELDIENISSDVYVDDFNTSLVNVNTVSGNLNFDNLSCESDIKINSVSGACVFENVTCKDFKIEATSGSITTKNINSDNVKFDTISGKIVLENVVTNDLDLETTSASVTLNKLISKDVNIKSISGKIDLGLEKCESSSIKTTSGKVSLYLFKDFGMKLDYKTSSGSFNSKIEYTVKNEVIYFGDGVCDMKIQTTSGNILIQGE